MRCLAGVILVVATGRAEAGEPPAIPSVIDKRWAASMGYGPSVVMSEGDRTATVYFDVGLRFRVIPELELGASIGGLITREDGYAAIGLDVRYRFAAERPWDPYVLFGVAQAVAPGDDEFHLGARTGLGVERRYRRWGFSGDLQLSRVFGDLDMSTAEAESVSGVAMSIAATYYWGSGGRTRRRVVP